MHYAAKKMKKMSLKMKKMSLKIQKSSLLYTEISLLYTERSMHIIMLLFPKGRQKVAKKRLGLWRPAGGLSKILKPLFKRKELKKIFDLLFKYLNPSKRGES